MDSRARTRGTRRLGTAAALAATGVIALGGCGGSDKPGYCSDRNNLEQSIKDLGDTQALKSGGLDELKKRLQKVEDNAKQLVQSAKGDFPSQANALDTSVTALKNDVQQLPSSPSAQQGAAVVTDAQAVVTAFNDFKGATQSKCK